MGCCRLFSLLSYIMLCALNFIIRKSYPQFPQAFKERKKVAKKERKTTATIFQSLFLFLFCPVYAETLYKRFGLT